jgi:hypothetical protein
MNKILLTVLFSLTMIMPAMATTTGQAFYGGDANVEPSFNMTAYSATTTAKPVATHQVPFTIMCPNTLIAKAMKAMPTTDLIKHPQSTTLVCNITFGTSTVTKK